MNKVRILAVSDMHGQLEPVRELLGRVAPDLLVCCGDWGDPGQLTAEDYSGLLTEVHTLTVFGNHDDLELLFGLRNRDGSSIVLKNGEVREVLGIKVAGISGIWAKSHAKPWYITDEEVAAAARAAARSGAELLLTHGCAVGLNDVLPGGRHGGQRCFLDAFEEVSACVYLCGHLHFQHVKRLKDGRITANVGNTSLGDYVLLEREDMHWNLEAGRLRAGSDLSCFDC